MGMKRDSENGEKEEQVEVETISRVSISLCRYTGVPSDLVISIETWPLGLFTSSVHTTH